MGGDASPYAHAQGAEHHAGLVVQFADGNTRTYCIAFTGDSISGLDLLLKTGLEVKVESYGGMGGLICKIGPDGCDYPEQPCVCQSYGPGGTYWSYTHLKNGSWKTSQQGASSYKVHDGDIEGWAWSSGKGPNRVPSFAQLCPNLQPAQPEPTATPRPQPPTPTLAPPRPANTTQATVAPIPVPPTGTPPLPRSVKSQPSAVASPSATRKPLITLSPTPRPKPSPTRAPTDQPIQPATPTSMPFPPTLTEAPTGKPTNTLTPPTETPLSTSTPLDTAISGPRDTPTVIATIPPTGRPTDIMVAAPSTATVQPTSTQTSATASSSPQALAQTLAVGIGLIVVGGLLLMRYMGARGGRQP